MTTIMPKTHKKINLKKQDIDELSGLLNHKSGEKKLMEYMLYATRHEESFVAVMLDINDVSVINEKFGHAEGDYVIQQVAKRLLEDLKDDEFAARMSGDEFFVVHQHTTKAEAKSRMINILSQLENDSRENSYTLGFCYGYMEVCPGAENTYKDVLSEVNNEMYRWKQRYHFEKNRSDNFINYHESKETREFSFDSNLLLSSLMKSTEDFIYVCNLKDHPGAFRYSKAMVEEFDLPDEIVHDAANVWGSKIHEADMKQFLESNQEIAEGRADYHNVEYRAKNKDGKWVWLRCRGHVERDVDDQPTLFAGFITCLNRKNKVDPLTGLFNKFEFKDSIMRMIGKAGDAPFYVMMLDLDEFSNINKLYNHGFGDLVLEHFAQSVQSILPENAKIFRNEGDEFFIILQQVQSNKEVHRLYENIQRKMNHQQSIDDKKYHCTVSAGCVKYPHDASDFMMLTKNVGYALEYSKKHGRNKLTFFDKKMLKQELRNLDMLEQLRYSIEHNFAGFYLNFQPLVDAMSGTIFGTEALARWHCDMYGVVPPLTFIPLLEKSGLIIEAGKWIFEEAIRQGTGWIAVDPAFKISINLSYLQVTDANFITFMESTLQKYEVSAKNVIVEMTESYIVKSDEEIHKIFDKIREIGIQIAMDDFGTGYSSLGILKNSPADIVKIDKIFMKDILINEFDATFIKFVVSLCHDVGIHVLLEGVETIEEYEKVRQMGLDFIQGYFFGKPLEGDAIVGMLGSQA